MIDVQRSRMRQLFYRKGKEKWDCRIFPSSFNVEWGKKKKNQSEVWHARGRLGVGLSPATLVCLALLTLAALPEPEVSVPEAPRRAGAGVRCDCSRAPGRRLFWALQEVLAPKGPSSYCYKGQARWAGTGTGCPLQAKGLSRSLGAGRWKTGSASEGYSNQEGVLGSSFPFCYAVSARSWLPLVNFCLL